MSTKTERTRTQIIALLGSGATHKEIAGRVGCSKKTVQRVAKSVKPELEEVEGQLTEYQRLLKERLPLEDRVDLYDKIARKTDKNPFAAMRALERIDDLDGVLTEKDRLRQQDQGSQQPHRPLFMFAPGSEATVNVTIAPPKPEAARSLSRQEIDVTPNGNDQDPEAARQLPEDKRST